MTPNYFFRLPMPKSFNTNEYAKLTRNEDNSARACYLEDALERFLYILYFPEKVRTNETYMLQFHQ